MKFEREIKNSLLNLVSFIEKNNFNGYDPYDALNSNLLRNSNNITKLLLTQFFVYSPINFRKLLSVKKGLNPKGIGLCLQAYCIMKKLNIEQDYSKINALAFWLINNSLNGFSGACWGYNFPWQSADSYKDIGTPTIVNTSFIANALLDAYELTGKKVYLSVAESSCNFILEDINIRSEKNRICFSYTPFSDNVIHNANVLGAVLLARVYGYNKNFNLLEYSSKAFDYTLSHQKSSGAWSYSVDPFSHKEREQIDWHQGFIINSIYDFIRYCQPKDDKYIVALKRGAEFYKTEQFLPDGRCKWRYPQLWPIDIHNQAQGIITFSKLSEIKPEYLDFAKKIAKWTIENMQDESGYFYYQKWPFFTNKILYMRWGQAWMMLALSTLLEKLKILKNIY